MVETEVGRFTIGVFQDIAWAQKGIEALKQAGFPPEALSIFGKETADLGAFIDRALGPGAERLDVAGVGVLLARGPLVGALQGDARDFAKLGIAATMRRVGFQAHDGRIYETLTARGGVMVAIRSEPRAADALAVLFSHGGGNAAIGAWIGRV